MNKQIETTMATKEKYKRLGDYIRLVDVRNQDLKVETLLGLSVEKRFFPSIANTIGTDMSTYKIIKSGQFVYIADTSRRGDKIAIALYDKNELAIVSQAYSVFEITDEEQLCPDYLMMWFRRPEFDRYARFKSHGSAREIFDWETMCDVMVPIPPIEEQRKTVTEYQTLVKRIEINNQLIAKLEDTAQAIYRNMFVDGIDKENLPEGWKMGKVGDYANFSQGIQVDVDNQFIEKKEGYNRFIRIIDYTANTLEPPRYVHISDDRYYCRRDDIVMIRYGDPGTVCCGIEGIIANNLFKIVANNSIYNNYLFYFLKSGPIQKAIKGSAASSTMPAITHTTIKNLDFFIPTYSSVEIFHKRVSTIRDQLIMYKSEIKIIGELQSLLLAKMGQ